MPSQICPHFCLRPSEIQSKADARPPGESLGVVVLEYLSLTGSVGYRCYWPRILPTLPFSARRWGARAFQRIPPRGTV
eukprot:4655335-Amphidinium_carterae.1